MKMKITKNIFAWIGVAFILTNLLVLFDVSPLREIFAFLFYSTVPGLLALLAIRFKKTDSWEWLVYSVGLSIALLMLVGLIINFAYPLLGITPKPLNPISILSSLNVSILFLFVIAFFRNKELDLILGQDFKFKSTLLAILYFFPFLLVLLSVFGIWLMNSSGNNILLMIMLPAIAVYILAITIFNKHIPSSTYPLAILLIALSLMLMAGLRTGNLLGWDVHGEYLTFQLTKLNSLWQPSNYDNAYNTCLSITILPTIFQNLTSIADTYVYKLLFQLLFVLVPLTIFLITSRYIRPLFAFLAAMFFMSQSIFTTIHISVIKNEIALLFFVLALLILFDSKSKGFNKNLLFLIFSIGLILSHYSTAYIFLALIATTKLSLAFKSKALLKYRKKITSAALLLFFALIFFWYGQVSDFSLLTLTDVIKQSISNIKNFFLLDVRSPIISSSLGVKEEGASLPLYLFHWGFGTLTRILLIAGVIFLAINFKKVKFRKDYLIMGFFSFLILIAAITLPQISKYYNIERIYMLSIVLICPAFILGWLWITKSIRISENAKMIVLSCILVIYFLNQIFFTVQLIGPKDSFFLNDNCKLCDNYIVHDEEVASGRLLAAQNQKDEVYGDKFALLRLWGYGIPYPKTSSSTVAVTLDKRMKDEKKHGFLYLRYANVKKEVIVEGTSKNAPTAPFSDYIDLSKADKVYSNKGSEIYHFS